MDNESNNIDNETTDFKNLEIAKSLSRPKNGPEHFIIRKETLQSTINHLYNAGISNKEAAVLWYGFYFTGVHNGADETINCYIQDFHPISYDEANIVSVSASNQEISSYIEKLTKFRTKPFSLFHIMMIHTHPGIAFHSAIDDLSLQKFGSGSYSLVVPNFAKERKILKEEVKCYFCDFRGNISEILDFKEKFIVIKDIMNKEIRNNEEDVPKLENDDKEMITKENTDTSDTIVGEE